MVVFDLTEAWAMIRQMLRDRLRHTEERNGLPTKRRAVMNHRGRISIEHSIKMPRFQFKTVVVLSVRGVGRRNILQSLVRNHPEKYAIPTLHTSRAPSLHEIVGNRYTFVTDRQMIHDFRGRKFLEFGLYENCHYGIKFDSVRTIMSDGKLALLEIDAKSLRHVRTAEFAPYVIFIAPPKDFERTSPRIYTESAQMQLDYAHMINMSIVNNDMDDTVKTMEVVLKDIVQSPQWVPIGWVGGQNRR